ncbi:GDP-L-fucose synthase [Candidatus Nitrosopelagicus sp.]|nr:GDP-L-fucose synthase [Candidatus Nitrosopelagicus sp.]
MNWSEKKVLVTGSSGFLGRYVVEELEKRKVKELFLPSSQQYDLRIQENCKKVVSDVDIIFHVAGTVGGIQYMNNNPAGVFYDNLMMGTHLIEEAKNVGIEKLILVGTVCSYPKFANIPFNEKQIWEGYPEETNASYGLAKKMQLVQSDAYRKQYKFNSISVIPTNMYGPTDNFSEDSSHVIPAIIKKIFQAKKLQNEKITLWGDGSPTRDFLYVRDTAKGIILAAEKYNESDPINLGSELEISIKELAEIIADLMDFSGQIEWDDSKPNGQPRRCVSNARAKELLEFKPETKIREGLEETITWFTKQQSS